MYGRVSAAYGKVVFLCQGDVHTLVVVETGHGTGQGIRKLGRCRQHALDSGYVLKFLIVRQRSPESITPTVSLS
jgi:hypothetical protein